MLHRNNQKLLRMKMCSDLIGTFSICIMYIHLDIFVVYVVDVCIAAMFTKLIDNTADKPVFVMP